MKKYRLLFWLSSLVCCIVALGVIFDSLKQYALDSGYVIANILIAIVVGFACGLLIVLIAATITKIRDRIKNRVPGERTASASGRPLIFLGACILAAAIILSGIQLFMWYKNKDTIDPKDRYYFGVNNAGNIISVADRETGKVSYKSSSLPDWYFK